MFSDSCNNSNQYIVSSASFNAMLNLFMKSAVLCALRLSAMFCPDACARAVNLLGHDVFMFFFSQVFI